MGMGPQSPMGARAKQGINQGFYDNKMQWWLMAFMTSKIIPKHWNEEKNKSFVRFHPKLRWFQLGMFEMWNEKRIGAEKPRNGFHTNLNFPQEIKPGITSYTYTYTYKYTHTYMYTYTYNIHDPLSSWIVCKFHSPAISTFWNNFILDTKVEQLSKRMNSAGNEGVAPSYRSFFLLDSSRATKAILGSG